MKNQNDNILMPLDQVYMALCLWLCSQLLVSCNTGDAFDFGTLKMIANMYKISGIIIPCKYVI